MKIRDVLAGKRRGVIAVRPDQPAAALPKMLDAHNISAVAVIGIDGRLRGIVTDKLVLKAMAQRNARLARLTVDDVMQTPAPTCTPDDSVTHAMRRMTDERVRHLLVLEDEHVIGIVSIGDLVKSRLTDAELESRVLRDIAMVQMVAR